MIDIDDSMIDAATPMISAPGGLLRLLRLLGLLGLLRLLGLLGLLRLPGCSGCRAARRARASVTGVAHRNDPAVIARLLSTPGRWAVVGLSRNTARPAYGVAAGLQRMGHTIVPVHPSAQEVHGAPGFRTLAEVPGSVDVVDVFVNSSLAGAVVDDAVGVGALAVWLQLGVLDEDAAARAAAAGLDVVMDACPMVEVRRLRR